MIVESSVPKNGTIATRPLKMPNGSGNGTPSTQRPNTVMEPRKLIVVSCATMYDRSVSASSDRRSRTGSRWIGGKIAMSHSRYSAGWRPK